MAKLTLSVDEHVVTQAKRYAAKRGTSVSRLVERYLSLVAREPRSTAPAPPILSMLRGAAKGIGAEEYGRHLVRKYRSSGSCSTSTCSSMSYWSGRAHQWLRRCGRRWNEDAARATSPPTA